MILKIVTGVNLAFLKFKMRINTLLLGPSSRKMFGHGCHTSGTQFLPLVAIDVGGSQAGGKGGIFTKSSGNARPPRLRREVNLRMESLANTNGEILLP